MGEGELPEREGRAAQGRRMLTNAGLGADRVLDRAQGQVFRLLWLFVPEPEIARNLWFQHLLASRFLTDAAQQALAFGALVAVAREGGSAVEVALVGVAALLPPALLGLYGGAIADTLPVRVALAGAYGGQALLCLLVPWLFGTGLGTVLVLLFLVNALGQVSGPTESSVLPLVANEAELASAASLINLASAAGGAFGMALLAPVLVRASGVGAVFVLSGLLLLLAASRVFDLPVGDKAWKLRVAPPNVRLRAAVRWLVRHPAVGTMIVLSVLAGTVNIVLQTLAPRYVEEALHADAANTAYVFAPTAVGLVVALVSAPAVIRMWGERYAAIAGLALAAASLFLLGDVDDLARAVDPVNPIRLASVFGLHLSRPLRTAGFLAMPLAFGVSMTATSVQTYINRRVPLAYQGRTFAMQSALRNGSAVFPLLLLGAAAAQFGVEPVLLVTPLLLLATAYGLLALSFRFAGLAPHSRIEVMESFWEEPELRRAPEARPAGDLTP
jgi:MFS family permease